MNKRKIALGPGAASVILIVVCLSLAMLSMLMIIGSRNDYNLCSRSAEMIERVFQLSSHSERRLAELDAVLVSCQKEASDQAGYLALVKKSLPEDMSLEDDLVTWTEPLDNRNLECIVRLLPRGEKSRTEWVSHKLIVEEPEDDWEW